MRKNSITAKALKLYHSFNPKYFPIYFFHQLFTNFSPYFSLWMSAEIVTALSEGRSTKVVYTLILMTLLGNLAVRVIGAVLKRTTDTQLTILKNNEAAALNGKTLSLDYDKLEAAITEKTKAIILPYPNNPTGAVMRRKDLEEIAEVLRGTDIMVLSDEIYAELTYGDERHVSIAEMQRS